jgi:beta-galactosidase
LKNNRELSIKFKIEKNLPTLILRENSNVLELEGPGLQIWRAPTDNDIIRNSDREEDKVGYKWYSAGLDRSISRDTDIINDHTFCSTYITKKDGLEVGLLTSSIIRSDSGKWKLKLIFNLNKDLPELPRVGVRFKLPAGFEYLSWYGRGLKENYPDRKQGYPINMWESTVTNEYVPYILPQEHGSHCDTRWVSLGSKTDNGQTFHISAEKPFIFSALHTSPESLDSLTHTWQVRPDAETYLIIDAAQRGLGTGACGPDCSDKYKILPSVYEMNLVLDFF